MLISIKAVKRYVKAKGKKSAPDFIITLDKKVTELIDGAIENSRHFPVLHAGDFLNWRPDYAGHKNKHL